MKIIHAGLESAGAAIMVAGLGYAFVLGCKRRPQSKALVTGWLLLVLGGLVTDLLAPLIALNILGLDAAKEMGPETPVTAAFLIMGWYPPIPFYWLGRFLRYVMDPTKKSPPPA